MTDIVERLRLVHEHDSRGIFKDAADEITALRSDNERLRAARAGGGGSMTHDITIPPEAVEAAARAYAIANEGHDEWWHLRAERITTALRAGIAAWPGMCTCLGDEEYPRKLEPHDAIILPLPTETRDE